MRELRPDMATLWLRFAEDSSLPTTMTAQARAQFETLFDPHTESSSWNNALRLLGLPTTTPPAALLCWHRDTPYINWSYVVQLISASMVQAEADIHTGFRYTVRYRLSMLLSLIASQWKISRYILSRLSPEFTPPTDTHARINESIALGLALLALTMRLPVHTPEQLATWLTDPSAQPSSLRRNITQIAGIQQLRSTFSNAWTQLFPDPAPDAPRTMCPESFWDVPPADPTLTTPTETISSWKGLPVSGNEVVARAVLIHRIHELATLPSTDDPLVFIFPLARPESVEAFERASAVLFGDGGLLCHACTIAREQNMPCITALGKPFIAQMTQALKENPSLWLSIMPETGIVTRIETRT